MSVLQGFSESQKEKLLYMSRVEARRLQLTEELEMKEIKTELIQTQQEVARLKALLAEKGIES